MNAGLAISLWWLCLLPASAATAPAPYDRLLIQQQGPADASLRPFSVEIGSPPSSTRDTVYVTAQTFAETYVLARAQAKADGAFALTFSDATRRRVQKVSTGAEGLAKVCGRLQAMFSSRGLAPPPFIAALAGS